MTDFTSNGDMEGEGCDEGHHHSDEDSGDEMFYFDSRHVNEALTNEAFDFMTLHREIHPLRFWAVAGWGPVPAVLRAPEGIYREVDLSCLYRRETGSPGYWADASFWLEIHQHENIIFQELDNIEVGDIKWIAVIDVRDDTTVENLRIPAGTCEDVACSHAELGTLLAPARAATEREYIEMTSGEFLVMEVNHSDYTWQIMARVGNAAVGKWFWELYPRRHGCLLSQLVVWHDSVDDTAEYKTPWQGNENDLINMGHFHRSPGVFDYLLEERKESLELAEIFLWIADAEPQLKHAMAKFMTRDPNLWWKMGEVVDGFLLSCFGFGWQRSDTVIAGELRCEKLCFADPLQALYNSMDRGSARNVMGGCAASLSEDIDLLPLQFKPSRATGKIVAMRAVFAVDDPTESGGMGIDYFRDVPSASDPSDGDSDSS